MHRQVGWTCSRTCARDSDCGEEQECAEVTRPGVDTIRICLDRRFARLGEVCEDKPCEDGTTCIYYDGTRRCFQNCQTRADCSGGLDCQPTRDGGGVCAPYVGASCIDDLDCPTGQICEADECSPFDPGQPQGGLMVDALMTRIAKAEPVGISMVRVDAVEVVISDFVITNAQRVKGVLSMKWATVCAVKW